MFFFLKEKQSQVDDLFFRANQLADEQTEKNNVIIYTAMAESLNSVWKELNQKLNLRGHILRDTFYFYKITQNQNAVIYFLLFNIKKNCILNLTVYIF